MNLSNQPRPARRKTLKRGDTFTHFCPFAKKEYTETIIEIHEEGIHCNWTFSWTWAELEEAGIIRGEQRNQPRKPRPFVAVSCATFHFSRAAREGFIADVLELISLDAKYWGHEIEFADFVKSETFKVCNLWAYNTFNRDAFWLVDIYKDKK